MKKIIGTIITTASLLTGFSAYAEATSNGEQLHASKCQGCHDNSVYTRANRFIKNRAALHEQVNRCHKQVRADWTDQQINNVVNYLDSQYYKF